MSHAIDESPDYILLAHFDDDSLAVICHYHGFAEEDEVNKDCANFFKAGHYLSPCLVRFQLAEVRLDSTPAMLGLTESAQ